MNGLEFEDIRTKIGEYFTRLGYTIEKSPKDEEYGVRVELYCGNRFVIPVELEDDLNKTVISNDVRKAFLGHNNPLSKTTTIDVADDKKWKITDGDKSYIIEKRKDEEGRDQLKVQRRNKDDVVVDITLAKKITSEDFFEDKKGRPKPLFFYRLYFSRAKLIFALPADAEIDNKFKDRCIKEGIGLLKFNEKGEVVEDGLKQAKTYVEVLTERIIRKVGEESKEDIMEGLDRSFLDLITIIYEYGRPEFQLRGIKGRMQISFRLLDKLRELKHLRYKDELIDLAEGFRDEYGYDYNIAFNRTTELWKKYLGLTYPSIQISAEKILQRDEKYREHFVHQFQVFLIGAYILDKLYDKDVWEKFEKKYDCKVEDVWLAASTYHDFNYGLQNFDVWLLQFFEDTLRVRNDQTKEILNLLNLDSAMIRESLWNKIRKMVASIGSSWDENKKEKSRRFLYEKTVRDRNHSVLSALSLLKLYDETSAKISKEGILRSALAVALHDEDIWEAFSGCRGYTRVSYRLKEEKCKGKCDRKVGKTKERKITEGYKCEQWEREFMREMILKPIKFDDLPIIYLLIFCDCIQDEGRVTGLGQDVQKKPLSSLEDIIVEKPKVTIKLRSDSVDDKKEELERVKWVLEEFMRPGGRFQVYISQRA